jgi:pentatricopeptide repeat protein
MRDYQERHERRYGALVMAYVRLGQHQDALDLFERAVSERSGGVVYANLSPIYDGLRSHPRFKALAARIGLPVPPADDVRPGS